MTYEQWQGGSKESFQLGCFMVNPPGTQCPPESAQLSFTLDAGVVFGNGTHPTTRDCLLAIEMACGVENIETMLDLGTGTGVLALGAARLGVRKIAAVDYNLLAARTARRNVQLNNLTGTIVVVNGRAQDFTGRPTDLMVANIHYDVMKSIVDSEGFLRQKLFVLSGLLNNRGAVIFDHNNLHSIVQDKRRDGIVSSHRNGRRQHHKRGQNGAADRAAGSAVSFTAGRCAGFARALGRRADQLPDRSGLSRRPGTAGALLARRYPFDRQVHA